MNRYYKNIDKLFYIFLLFHLVVWTLVPSLTNQNLPLDTIEALAWSSNLDWGFNKHPPMSAFFPEIFYRIFGPNDWAFYFLSQLFVIIAFYFVYKFSIEIFKNKPLSFLSVIVLESIYFYNFTTPEFNVNVCQLPFWSLVVYYSWKIYNDKIITFRDCVLIGLFAALGFLSKYLFVYLLLSISLFFIFIIFSKKEKKFDFKYIIILEVFLILLVPHFIWLSENNYITLTYGLARTGFEEKELIDHIKYPLSFIGKQIGILIPFFLLIFTLTSKVKFKIDKKNKKLIFLIFVSVLPIFFMFLTSLISGSKIRTMWMTPFYLFFFFFFFENYKKHIYLIILNKFFVLFFILLFLSPSLYGYISITKDNKRTDYPGKEIAELVERRWSKNFSNEIKYVIGDEWIAGNLSYHMSSRPIWFQDIKGKADQLDPSGGIVYTGNADILKQVCPGDFGKIKKQGFCMIGSK